MCQIVTRADVANYPLVILSCFSNTQRRCFIIIVFQSYKTSFRSNCVVRVIVHFFLDRADLQIRDRIHKRERDIINVLSGAHIRVIKWSSGSSSMMSVPPEVKSLQPFLRAAREFEKRDPVVSYYCK